MTRRTSLDIRIADHPGAPSAGRPAGSGAYQLAEYLIAVADQAVLDLVHAPRHRDLLTKCCKAWIGATRTDIAQRGRLIDDGHATIDQIAWPIPSASALGVTANTRAVLLAGLRSERWLRFPPGNSGAIPAIGDIFTDRTHS